MEIKGTAVAALPLFVESKFGKEGLEKWLNSLSGNAKAVYSSSILSSKWYSLKEILIEPTQKVCELFYRGNIKGAEETGKFSAEYGLKGVLKIFVKMGTPSFLVSRASTILPQYYKPSKMETLENTDKGALVRITEFPEINDVIEHRIMGWMIKALEIQGCKGVRTLLTQSLTKGAPATEFKVSWL